MITVQCQVCGVIHYIQIEYLFEEDLNPELKALVQLNICFDCLEKHIL